MSNIVVLIPAHNEERLLPAAIQSIHNQTVAASNIVVVCDNCTDHTIDIAEALGATALETTNNRHKKAGALNQILMEMLPGLPDDDWVFVVDADSQPAPDFIRSALAVARRDDRVGAVGGIFLAEGNRNLLGHLQASEYTRYAREIGRDEGRARVLTGTSTMTRVSALRRIMQARAEGSLPGTGIYNDSALCEDFELTLALKHLGYRCVSPKQCTVATEVMDTTSQLWRQRIRWQRGAVQALHVYGVNRHTMPYIAKQALTGFGQIMMLSIIVITLIDLFTGTLGSSRSGS